MKLTANVMTFASNNMELFAAFKDYWNHYQSVNAGKTGKRFEFDASKSLDEKDAIICTELKKYIIKRSGVNYASESNVSEWFNHPLVQHEMYAVVGALVDMVIPDSIVDTIGLYTDIRQIGFGDSAAFDITARDLFVVSKSSRGHRTSQVNKQFKGQVTIVPENHELSVGVSLYGVLAGKESLAELTAKIVQSMETAVTLDAYNAFATAMAALDTTATTGLKITGYTQANLVRLCEQVTTWNGGAKPIVAGTALALQNILPDDANYRYTLTDSYVTLGYINTLAGYDIMKLPQVVNISTPFDRALSDNYLWVVSPSANKLLKLVLEGQTWSFVNGPFDNANLQQNSTLNKSWGVGVATNSAAATCQLS